MSLCKLQTSVYDILPSTTAAFSYAIGFRKLSANEQFFFLYWYSNSSKFVRNNSNYIRRLSVLITDHVAAYASSNQLKPKSFESRRNSFFFFKPGVDASHVYGGAWALGLIHSLISTQTDLSEGADRVDGQLRGDKRVLFPAVA